MKFARTEPLVVFLLVILSPATWADKTRPAPDAAPPSALPTVSLTELLESVATKSGQEFLIDSRVQADVVVGQLDWRDITYPVLHTVLRNNELAAVTVQGKVNIVPVDAIRQYALPVLLANDQTFADDEWVSRLVRPQNADASMMVPVFRPLLGQQHIQ